MNNKPQEFAKFGLDSIVFFANTYFDSIERLAALNLSAARSFAEAAFANLSAFAGAKDVQSLITLQQSLTGPAIEKGLDYSRGVFAITAETKDKITKEVEAKVADANSKVTTLVEQALANAPAGSEVAVAAVKSAISAANDAYQGLSKAGKQVAEATEASVAAATKATIKAASAATKAA